MTHIPRYFLALFASLHEGDEITLNKGLGEENWKIELAQQLVPRGKPAPLPLTLWGDVLSVLAWDWQGKIRFYSDASPHSWRVSVVTCPPIEKIRLAGLVPIRAAMSHAESKCVRIA